MAYNMLLHFGFLGLGFRGPSSAYDSLNYSQLHCYRCSCTGFVGCSCSCLWIGTGQEVQIHCMSLFYDACSCAVKGLLCRWLWRET